MPIAERRIGRKAVARSWLYAETLRRKRGLDGDCRGLNET